MNNSQTMDWNSIEKTLHEVLCLASGALYKAGLGVQVDDIHILIDAGEYGVALEQLCSHLDEIAQPISLRIYELIEKAGELMKMEPSTWEHLLPLVKRH